LADEKKKKNSVVLYIPTKRSKTQKLIPNRIEITMKTQTKKKTDSG